MSLSFTNAGYKNIIGSCLNVIPRQPYAAVIFSVVIAGLANGLSVRAAISIRDHGWLGAISSTFGISVIVWFSVINALSLLRQADFGVVRVRDGLILAVAVCGFLFPLPSAAWVGLSVLAAYFLLMDSVSPEGRRAFWVVLALAVSMQWGRWLNQLFLPVILEIDSVLVSSLSGYERFENLVVSPGGLTLQIQEACSSFVNVSLAVLAWVSARAYFNTRGLRRGAFYLSVMIFLVVLVNTVRISLIGVFPHHYETIHGAIGAFVANTVTTLIVFTVSVIGARK